MRVVVLSTNDERGGAAVVSLRLTEALWRMGVDARMLVVNKEGSSPLVVRTGGRLRARVAFLAEHARIFLGNGLSRSDLFKVSIATDGLPLSRHPLVREADAVIINWVNQGMISLKEIGRMASGGRRVVWTMHDMWNFTGVCHHAGTCAGYTMAPGCGACPLLHGCAGPRDLSRRTWRRKKDLYGRGGIRFVAVSSWLAELARRSTLLGGHDVAVIPNAFPLRDFSPAASISRGELGLPEGKKLVVMGAARLDDPVKGLDSAIRTLNRLRERGDFAAVFFGDLRRKDLLSGLEVPYVWLGPIEDKRRLAAVYAHSAVVLSSSFYETLPGTLIEGQASGCYPVAFSSGGQSDIIDSPRTGWLARSRDEADLARGVARGLDGEFEQDELRRSVEERFSAESVARAYLRLIGENQ